MTFFSQVPLVISYYTKNTPYEEEVQGLISSCREFEIEHYVEGIEDLGSWEKNCATKPEFVRRKMEEHKRPLLWVDADAVFLQPLVFEDFMFADVSLVRNSEQIDPRFCVNAGTVYFNATVQGKNSLDLWCQYSQIIQKESKKILAFQDQVSLYFAVLATPSSSVSQMPKRYCKIFDAEGEKAVIEHRQASRRYHQRALL